MRLLRTQVEALECKPGDVSTHPRKDWRWMRSVGKLSVPVWRIVELAVRPTSLHSQLWSPTTEGRVMWRW